MIDDLLPYYNSELRFLREMAKEFSRAHPKIAGRLRLAGETIEDPLVGQLVEAVAFLNARTRKKLDDDFPELVGSLLEVLHPQYVAPLPSMSVVAFQPDGQLAQPSVLPKGSVLETEAVDGEHCNYRTCYPVTLMPVRISAASLVRRPFHAPPNPAGHGASALLRIVLQAISPDFDFAQRPVDRLRFHLAGEIGNAYKLHELITNNVVSIAVASDATDTRPLILPASAVRMVGLEADEVLTPPSPACDPSYALLSEAFAFPQKFLFFEIEGLSGLSFPEGSAELHLYLFCNHPDDALERSLSTDDFALFATPVVNLFSGFAEPLKWDPTRPEQRVIPDAHRDAFAEVYSVDSVEVTRADGASRTHHPMFRPRVHNALETGHFYHVARRPSPLRTGGQDCYLSLVDLSGALDFEADDVVTLRVTCTNRSLPARLPVGGGHPIFQFPEGASGVQAIRCLTPPTPTRYPLEAHGRLWKLLSHLVLNHFALDDDGQGAAMLSEIMALHDPVDSAVTREVRSRVQSVLAKSATARTPSGGPIVMVAGVEILLTLKDKALSGSGAYLLACVLERFLANHVAVNSFTRLRLKLAGEPGDLRVWPARSGATALA